LDDIDEKAGSKVDPNNLIKLLGELGSDYSGVLKATERLQRIALSKRPTDYAALKQSLIRRKIANAVPINEVLCEVSALSYEMFKPKNNESRPPWIIGL
jgi:hypothetical protein